MNGVDLHSATHEVAVQTIKSSGSPVTFVVQSLIHWVKSRCSPIRYFFPLLYLLKLFIFLQGIDGPSEADSSTEKPSTTEESLSKDETLLQTSCENLPKESKKVH